MRTRKWMAVLASGMLIFSAFPSTVFPNENKNEDQNETEQIGKYASKDEVIYGNLDPNGNTEEMFVVNTFHVTKPGKVVDHGDYTNVRNLTNLTDLKQADNSVHFQAEEGEFYYQGELKNQPLPWNISITYLLDGKKVNPDELAGKDGSLEIQIKTTANEDVNQVFFENYLLQISLTFDPEIFDNVLAPEGTKANSGKNQQISFSALPGQEEEFIVTANVSDLEMEPISISAVPANLSVEKPNLSDMTGEMETLTDAIQAVNSGVSELNRGISDLSSGASELSNGSSEYRSGISELNQSSGELVNGSGAIRDALNQISESVQGDIETPDLSQLEQLPEGLRELAKGLRESSDGIATLKENYGDVLSNLDEAITSLPDEDIDISELENLTEEQVQALKELNINVETIQQLTETYTSAKKVKEAYLTVKENVNSITEKLEQASIPTEEMASHLETMATEIEKGLENVSQMEALTQLQEGLSTLSSEYGTFHDGLVSYTEGVSSLSSSYEKLDTGIKELSEGTSSLNKGANELENGTQELEEETSNLPGQVESEVDEMLEEFDFSDFEPTSFVSEENEKIEVVQFVLQTEAIEVKEPETEEQEEEEEKGFWDKLMDLF